MFAQPPLLTLKEGVDGPFRNWLNDLGLSPFIEKYGLRNIIAWGWLQPQCRVVYPHEFFLSWVDYPNTGAACAPEYEQYSIAWDSTWFIDETASAHWFLHPLFHPGDDTGALLFDDMSKDFTKIPPSFQHPRGIEVTPYADLFFPWQGYALVDVIRAADIFQPLINTPNAVSDAERLVRTAEFMSSDNPAEDLSLPTRWAGLAPVMTAVAHYKSLRSALGNLERKQPVDHAVRKAGAEGLAAHLGITATSLHADIESRLLVLASQWKWANEKGCRWTPLPYELLRWDILIAVEWLCFLTGKRREDYLKEWQYENRMRSECAQLKDVLPIEGFINREKFLELMPHYLKTLNSLLPASDRFEGPKLTQVVDTLRDQNYPFGSFIGAFRDMHDELSYQDKPNKELDFRELRPLDGYLVLAIRAEAVCRSALENSQQLAIVKKHGLEGYIKHIADQRGMSAQAIQVFTASLGLTQLHNLNGANPIQPIIQLPTKLSAIEEYLVKSFLCCVLARNYFAHHFYFDAHMARSKDSGYLLSGVLSAVLWLHA